MIDVKEDIGKEFNQKITNMAEAIPGCKVGDRSSELFLFTDPSYPDIKTIHRHVLL